MTPEVWAPNAEAVELVTEAGRHPMGADDPGSGWYVSDVDIAPGSVYAFALDGGSPRPDPRSRHQPAGVDGWSQVVDVASWPRADGRRGVQLPSQVIYELHVGTFSPAGTFAGAAEHLDQLVDLGVGMVELMPVAEFPGRWGWGYDGVDLFAARDAYGGPEGLAGLVDACAARGLGVLLDVVYNHLGPAGNHLGEFGPYFTSRHATPWGDGVNVDGPGADEVRGFLCDNALFWLRDMGFDGLRLDAVHGIVDQSARPFLEQLAGDVRVAATGAGRPMWLVAESDLNDPRLVRPVAAGGFGLDAQWCDDWHHAVHAALTGETAGYYGDFHEPGMLARALTEGYVYQGEHQPSRGRRHGRPPTGVRSDQLVVAMQNHDQVGNRARGERLVHLAGEGAAHVAAALLLTSPFVPLLFQGEEWGASSPFPYFVDHADPVLAQAIRDGRSAEFADLVGQGGTEVPDPLAEETFLSARLDWDERGHGMHARLLSWHRDLIALRQSCAGLAAGAPAAAMEVSRCEAVVVEREGVAIVAHLGKGSADVPAPGGDVLLASPGAEVSRGRLRGDGPVAAILATRDAV
jgi:maltooligosyltrehalose trehalohydrolase